MAISNEVLEERMKNIDKQFTDFKTQHVENWKVQQGWNEESERKIDEVLSTVKDIRITINKHVTQHDTIIAKSLTSQPVRSAIEDIFNRMIIGFLFGKTLMAKVIRVIFLIGIISLFIRGEFANSLVSMIFTHAQ